MLSEMIWMFVILVFSCMFVGWRMGVGFWMMRLVSMVLDVVMFMIVFVFVVVIFMFVFKVRLLLDMVNCV